MHSLLTTITTTLLWRVRCGDDGAWELVNFIYGALIYRYLGRCGIDEADRADICQETMLAAFMHIDSFQRDRSKGQSFKAWLKKIASNKAKDYLKRKREITVADLVVSDEPEEEANAEEVSLLFQRTVTLIRDEFSDEAWEILQRVVIAEEYLSTVAESLGISINALYLRKSRMIKKLRARMANLAEFQN